MIPEISICVRMWLPVELRPVAEAVAEVIIVAAMAEATAVAAASAMAAVDIEDNEVNNAVAGILFTEPRLYPHQ